jgi:hypothetical protein
MMMMVGGSDEAVRDFKTSIRDNKKVGFRFRESFFIISRHCIMTAFPSGRERLRG